MKSLENTCSLVVQWIKKLVLSLWQLGSLLGVGSIPGLGTSTCRSQEQTIFWWRRGWGGEEEVLILNCTRAFSEIFFIYHIVTLEKIILE